MMYFFQVMVCLWAINKIESANEITAESWTMLSDTAEGEIRQAMRNCERRQGYSRMSPSTTSQNISLLTMDPPNFLTNFANPCWIECLPSDGSPIYPSEYNHYLNSDRYRDAFQRLTDYYDSVHRSWRLRCIPKFYLIGMAKCGTTDLFVRINSHPDVISIGKEIDFWSTRESCPNQIYDFERYIDIGDTGVRLIQRNIRIDEETNRVVHPVIFGDGTPSTLFSNSRWVTFKDAKNTSELHTPKVISHLQPDAKLVIILRNPVTMTFSSYKFFSRDKDSLSVDKFHECVVYAAEKLVRCNEEHDVKYCAILPTGYLVGVKKHPCQFVLRSLQKGQYHIFIEEWLRYFSIDQFFILKLENYSSQKATWLLTIWRWLGLRTIPRGAIHLDTANKINSNSARNDMTEMLPKTEVLLKDFFRTANTKLVRLLNDQQFNWYH